MVAVRAVVGTVSDEATGSATGTEADHTDPRAGRAVQPDPRVLA